MTSFYSTLLHLLLVLPAIKGQDISYCQPGESCWPTKEEIEAFSASLSTTDARWMILASIISICSVMLSCI